MITTIEQGRKAYIEHLQKCKSNSVRMVENALNKVSAISAKEIRQSLIEDGIITVTKGAYDANRNRNTYLIHLTGKPFGKQKLKPTPKPVKTYVKMHWDDGTIRSIGNAFNWQTYAQGLFSKQELAAMRTKIQANPHFTGDSVHTYSKAKPNV